MSNEQNDEELNERIKKLLGEFDEFMDDDFSTAKVLANMFEIVPIINGIKDKHIASNSISTGTLTLLKTKMKIFVEDIFGLKTDAENNEQMDKIIQLLVTIRKEAKTKKDFVTSDKIRNELAALGIQLKDEKDGNVSYSLN